MFKAVHIKPPIVLISFRPTLTKTTLLYEVLLETINIAAK